MTNLKQIEKVVKEFNNDEMAIQKELKRIQSVKCRLKKQKGKSTYEKEMTETLKYGNILLRRICWWEKTNSARRGISEVMKKL